MTKRKSVTLRTFVTDAVKSNPVRSKKAERIAEHRLQIVHSAVDAAQRGSIRRLDGARYTTESARVNAYQLYNELVGV